MTPLVVVGDALLDVDVEGTAERLCPEAPVPVVDVERRWQRPGGAGLAATLLATRTAPEVVLVTALGDDDAGRRLAELLAHDVQVVRLPMDGETVCKTRLRAAGQSLARVDTGGGRAARAPLPGRAVRALRSAGAILVSDYGRGVAAHPGLRDLLTELAPRVPVVWDPHPRGPAPVPGVRLATPNDSEALAFAGDCSDAADAAHTLRSTWSCTATAVTVGPRGALLAGPGDGPPVTVPVSAPARAAGHGRPDTCGAGDRFASAATAALAGGSELTAAVSSAVDAASRFVAAGGAAALSVDGTPAGEPESAFGLADRVRRQGGRLVATGGCFDLLHPGHVSLLRQARSLGDALVVCLNSDESVRGLKGPARPVVPAEDRARLLLELESVDAVVVFDEPSPEQVLARLRPDVWVKGGDYAEADLPEAGVVRRHGGEVVLVPTVAGYSTTHLLTHHR
ncbi:PfkB family carbohydrate kinase [Prauserella muralis]|uniref:D-beta-D-heptose 1-phosphate adenosyltransferase n=1 Tax=Prauserella muralis TaxID=588067 RepID=A0A2V4B1R6_9PSEU|nr:PfkB family carbohydrate kinase [Prauserella muralis]PXY27318.1 D-beta-D-heptose 1-phosphate adenosyltransferase [Prauserella muralis]TWE23003.1 rfaE bifunctional protein kinase chain/domain/rfaE bifunctional protein nucleotidyltransferase chain/domain [Prauserella muralis]